jgi:acyl carrier protein
VFRIFRIMQVDINFITFIVFDFNVIHLIIILSRIYNNLKIIVMEEKLINFIKNEYLGDEEMEITPDTKLISTGLIDSFSLVSLQAFIEREFKKRIPAPKITAASFDTVKQMVEIINQF